MLRVHPTFALGCLTHTGAQSVLRNEGDTLLHVRCPCVLPGHGVSLLCSAQCPTVSQLLSSCPRVSLWLLSIRSRDLIFLQGRSILHRAGWRLGQLCTSPLNSAGEKKLYPSLNLDEIMICLKWKGSKVSQLLLCCACRESLHLLSICLFVCFAKPTLSRRT